jgi:hypothetical protein
MIEPVERRPVSYSISLEPGTRWADLACAEFSAIAHGQAIPSRRKHRSKPLLLPGHPIVPWCRLTILAVTLCWLTDMVKLAGILGADISLVRFRSSELRQG